MDGRFDPFDVDGRVVGVELLEEMTGGSIVPVVDRRGSRADSSFNRLASELVAAGAVELVEVVELELPGRFGNKFDVVEAGDRVRVGATFGTGNVEVGRAAAAAAAFC